MEGWWVWPLLAVIFGFCYLAGSATQCEPGRVWVRGGGPLGACVVGRIIGN